MSDYISVCRILSEIALQNDDIYKVSAPRDGFTSLQVGIYDMFKIIFKDTYEFHNPDDRIIKMIIDIRNFVNQNDVEKVYEIGTKLCCEVSNLHRIVSTMSQNNKFYSY